MELLTHRVDECTAWMQNRHEINSAFFTKINPVKLMPDNETLGGLLLVSSQISLLFNVHPPPSGETWYQTSCSTWIWTHLHIMWAVIKSHIVRGVCLCVTLNSSILLFSAYIMQPYGPTVFTGRVCPLVVLAFITVEWEGKLHNHQVLVLGGTNSVRCRKYY